MPPNADIPPHDCPVAGGRFKKVAAALEADEGAPQVSLPPPAWLAPQVEPAPNAKIWVVLLAELWMAGSREREVRSTVSRLCAGAADGDCIMESMLRVGSKPRPNC